MSKITIKHKSQKTVIKVRKARPWYLEFIVPGITAFKNMDKPYVEPPEGFKVSLNE